MISNDYYIHGQGFHDAGPSTIALGTTAGDAEKHPPDPLQPVRQELYMLLTWRDNRNAGPLRLDARAPR